MTKQEEVEQLLQQRNTIINNIYFVNWQLDIYCEAIEVWSKSKSKVAESKLITLNNKKIKYNEELEKLEIEKNNLEDQLTSLNKHWKNKICI